MNLIKNKNDKMIFSYNTSFKTFMFKHFFILKCAIQIKFYLTFTFKVL